MVKDRGDEGYAPDMWIDMVSSTDKRRMGLAGYKGAHVRIYVASCPAEEAVKRAYERAEKRGGPDEGRYVPTEKVLNSHRSVSHALPKVLSEGPCVLPLCLIRALTRKYTDIQITAACCLPLGFGVRH